MEGSPTSSNQHFDLGLLKRGGSRASVRSRESRSLLRKRDQMESILNGLRGILAMEATSTDNDRAKKIVQKEQGQSQGIDILEMKIGHFSTEKAMWIKGKEEQCQKECEEEFGRRREDLEKTMKKTRRVGLYERGGFIETADKNNSKNGNYGLMSGGLKGLFKKSNTKAQITQKKVKLNNFNSTYNQIIGRINNYGTEKKLSAQNPNPQKNVDLFGCSNPFLNNFKPKPKILFGGGENPGLNINPSTICLTPPLKIKKSANSGTYFQSKNEILTTRTRSSLLEISSEGVSSINRSRRKERQLKLNPLDKSFILFEGKIY